MKIVSSFCKTVVYMLHNKCVEQQNVYRMLKQAILSVIKMSRAFCPIC